jgi:hypothetical protein
MLSNKDPPPSQGVLSSSQESKRIREWVQLEFECIFFLAEICGKLLWRRESTNMKGKENQGIINFLEIDNVSILEEWISHKTTQKLKNIIMSCILVIF